MTGAMRHCTILIRTLSIGAIVAMLLSPTGFSITRGSPGAVGLVAGLSVDGHNVAPVQNETPLGLSSGPPARSPAQSFLPGCVPCPGTGGCLPQCASVQMYVAVYLENTSAGFVDAAQITINGVAVKSPPAGKLETFNWFSATSIGLTNFQQYCTPICFRFIFLHWYATSGTFANPSSQSTSFTAASSGGSLGTVAAVLETPLTISQAWSGYVASGTHITAVSGLLGSPTSTSYVSGVTNGCSSDEYLASWVGIGGLNGITEGLWQGGLLLHYSSSTSGLQEGLFVEYLSLANEWTWYANYNVTVNVYDPVQANIWVSGSQLYFQFADSVTKNVLWGGAGGETWSQLTGLPSGVYPDPTTAEWVAEAPECGGNSPRYVSPSFNGIYFENPDWTDSGIGYSQWLAPIELNQLYSQAFQVNQAVCPSQQMYQEINAAPSASFPLLAFTEGYTWGCL